MCLELFHITSKYGSCRNAWNPDDFSQRAPPQAYAKNDTRFQFILLT